MFIIEIQDVEKLENKYQVINYQVIKHICHLGSAYKCSSSYMKMAPLDKQMVVVNNVPDFILTLNLTIIGNVFLQRILLQEHFQKLYRTFGLIIANKVIRLQCHVRNDIFSACNSLI